MSTQLNILDKGFIRLVDYMGNDNSIVQAARVSYGDGIKTQRLDDELIHYLMKNAHTSPFEQVVFKFHIKMPIFIARQWVRHRNASINEISARYSVMKNEFYIPKSEHIYGQHSSNKQCSEDNLHSNIQTVITNTIEKNGERCYENYEYAISQGVSREQARMMLPVNIYTELYWKIDLHNLFHFLKLRMHKHAQAEIQEYATSIFQIVKTVCPISSEAFQKYVLDKKEL